ncbi:MAG: ComEA family DNA-binding protein [Phycisphaerae bacterium]
MSRGAPLPLTVSRLPRVAERAALGAGILLLALHCLTAGTPAASERPPIAPEQVWLRLDPDAATRDELMLLPRIGPTIADYIIEYRESVRPRRAFHRAEDLANVHRIGPLTVAQLRPFLCFPPARTDDTNAEVAWP